MAEESRHRLVPKAIVFLLALTAVAVGGAIFAAYSSGSSTSTQSAGGGSPPSPGVGGTPTVQKTITIDPGTNPSKGPADAKVTIVEFSDFQSPQCGAFAQQTLPQILANYGDKVRFVFMNVPPPSDPYAEKAAEAGECAHAQ